MATATDAGVRSGKNSTEMWMFLGSAAMILLNGTTFINVPWDTITLFLGISGLGIGSRAMQKTVATYVTGKAPAEPPNTGERNVPTA